MQDIKKTRSNSSKTKVALAVSSTILVTALLALTFFHAPVSISVAELAGSAFLKNPGMDQTK